MKNVSYRLMIPIATCFALFTTLMISGCESNDDVGDSGSVIDAALDSVQSDTQSDVQSDIQSDIQSDVQGDTQSDVQNDTESDVIDADNDAADGISNDAPDSNEKPTCTKIQEDATGGAGGCLISGRYSCSGESGITRTISCRCGIDVCSCEKKKAGEAVGTQYKTYPAPAGLCDRNVCMDLSVDPALCDMEVKKRY